MPFTVSHVLRSPHSRQGIFGRMLRDLVQSTVKAHQFASVGQSLKVGQGNSRCPEITGAGNAHGLDEVEGTIAMVHMIHMTARPLCYQMSTNSKICRHLVTVEES